MNTKSIKALSLTLSLLSLLSLALPFIRIYDGSVADTGYVIRGLGLCEFHPWCILLLPIVFTVLTLSSLPPRIGISAACVAMLANAFSFLTMIIVAMRNALDHSSANISFGAIIFASLLIANFVFTIVSIITHKEENCDVFAN